jgi:SAM-dependent methyltransferase
MQSKDVKAYFEQPSVVDHYARATNNIGLWRSEEAVFTQYFNWDDTLIELGTGAGRIAIGLWEIGYRNLLGTDLSKAMVAEARRINQVLDYGVAFQVADATALKYEDGQYDGAIFGFNGIMQIPGRQQRQKAMSEVYRLLVPGSYFIFTTHDRNAPRHRSYWKQEQQAWNKGRQNPALNEYGDICWDTPEGGQMFIHSPLAEEVRQDLKQAGFRVEWDRLRSAIAVESDLVRDFSDDCRFWVAQKPLQGTTTDTC